MKIFSFKHLFLCHILASLLLCNFTGQAQTQKQWMKYGDKSFKERDYYGASLYFRKAMLLDSSNLEVVNRYAESLRLYNEYELAEKYYRYVYLKDQGKNFKEALFWYASMQKYNAKYQDARKNFQRFTTVYKDKESFYYKKAKQEVKSCEFAQSLMNDTLPVTVSNLGPSINSTNAEFSPAVINDSTLYFSSLRSDKIKEISNEVNDLAYHIRIYTASKGDTGWVFKNELNTTVNSGQSHNGNGVYSPDKTRFYFTRCNEDFECNIYVSDIKDGQWASPRLAENELNMEGYTSTQPSLTTIDGKEVIFFISDRPGGLGKLDIWYGVLEQGKLLKAINAGPKLNSIDEETTPYYSLKDQALYFSSAWHFGLGGYDIFKSKGKFEAFDEPVNVGYPINTSVNDFYFTFYDNLSSGFLTSNRKGSITAKGETCCNDLWSFNYIPVPVKDSVPIASNKELFIPVRLYFHNDEPGPRSWDTVTSLNYQQTYKEYTLLKEKYIQEYSRDLSPEERIKAEKKIDILFADYVDKGAANLEAFTEQLIKRLEKGEKLEITVKGYASPLAKTDYNINLTLRRISSMENYIKSYKDSICLPYFNGTAPNGGEVSIVRVPFGEYKAAGGVNDNLREQKHSVFSPEAALERKIEIVSVTRTLDDSISTDIRFTKEIYNFGSVNAGDTLVHTFRFKNIGKKPMLIINVKDSCDCVTAKWEQKSVAPGQMGNIEVQFFTQGLKGKQAQHFWVESNATTKELTITTEVVEE